MNRKTKLALLAVGVALAAGLALKGVIDAVRPGGNQVITPEAWQDLTPQERERKMDEAERKRRAMGRPPLRQLPEDPPGGPPKAKGKGKGKRGAKR